MRDLLRRFGAVPLALAAYNAGPGAVAACGCVPPYRRDARLRRADPRACSEARARSAGGGLEVRLVRVKRGARRRGGAPP